MLPAGVYRVLDFDGCVKQLAGKRPPYDSMVERMIRRPVQRPWGLVATMAPHLSRCG